MTSSKLTVIYDAIETALRDGPLTTTQVAAAVLSYETALDGTTNVHPYGYTRTYARLTTLAANGKVTRQKLENGQVIWMMAARHQDDLEDLWQLPSASKD